MKRLYIQTVHPNACYQFNSDFTKTPYVVDAEAVLDDNGSIVMVNSLPSDMYEVKEVDCEKKILVVSGPEWWEYTAKDLEEEIMQNYTSVEDFFECNNMTFVFENGDFRQLTEDDFETRVSLKL
mgnify:CR=1 FL=1